MEWNKTKTIFIIAFLILDIFLGYQFFEKRSSSEYEVIKNSNVEKTWRWIISLSATCLLIPLRATG